MKRWRAPRDPRTPLALLAALLLGAAAVVAALRLTRQLRGPLEAWPITLSSFGLALVVIVSVVAATLVLWSGLRRASLGYELDRNAIYVRRWGSHYTIPLHLITSVISPERPASERSRLRFGRGQAAQTLLLSTAAQQYSLAVRQRDLFVRELQERRQLGVVQPQIEGWTWQRPALHAFWSAATVRRLLVTTVLLNVLLWALLAWRYPLLPETIPVRFDPLGGTAGTRPRISTLLLPGVASAMWLSNLGLAALLYRRVRLASELLLLGALLVQAAILIATAFIITIAR